MIDTQTLPVGKQFYRRLIKPDTWILNAFVPDHAMPHPYVVMGKEYALVIDSTDLPFNVREYVDSFADGRKLMTATTHTHRDHAWNNYQFDDCPVFMSEKGRQSIEHVRATRDDPRHRWIPLGSYTATAVKGGDVIDLGGREIECVDFCCCHAPTSIAFFDRRYGILFPGDEFEGGQVLLNSREDSCVEKYRDGLLRAKEVLSGRLKLICPPHNGSPIDPLFLDYMLENCERILSGIDGDRDTASMTYLLNPNEPRSEEELREIRFDKNRRRSEWKGTSIVYNLDRVSYGDLTKTGGGK